MQTLTLQTILVILHWYWLLEINRFTFQCLSIFIKTFFCSCWPSKHCWNLMLQWISGIRKEILHFMKPLYKTVLNSFNCCWNTVQMSTWLTMKARVLYNCVQTPQSIKSKVSLIIEGTQGWKLSQILIAASMVELEANSLVQNFLMLHLYFQMVKWKHTNQ